MTDTRYLAEESHPHSEQAEEYRQGGWILLLVTISVVLVSTSLTVLAIALPVVVRTLDASALEASWLLLVPGLITACVLVPLGRVADLTNRRTMFVAGSGLFALSSVLAGFATSAMTLILLCGVQAIGSAMVTCNTGAIVGTVFRGPRLTWAMGIYLAGVSVAQVAGPAIGGLISESLGWQWLFWIPAPLGLVCVLMGTAVLRDLPRAVGGRKGVDLLGTTVLAGILAGLLYSLSVVQSSGLSGWGAYAGFIVAALLIPLLVVIERRVTDPILPLGLLATRSFRSANLASMLSVIPRFEVVFVVGLYLQVVQHESARDAGLKVLPLPIGILIGSLIADRVTRNRDICISGLASAVGTAIGIGALGVALHLQASVWLVIVPLFLLGVGSGVFSAVNSSLIIGQAPLEDLGRVNGIRLLLMQLGGAIGVGLCLVVMTSFIPVEDRSSFYSADRDAGLDPDTLTLGFDVTFALMAAFALASGWFHWRARDGDRRDAQVTQIG